MLRTAGLVALRAARSGNVLESTAARCTYVISGAAKQASVQPQAAVPALSFARGFAAAAEPAPAPSSEGTVTQVLCCVKGPAIGTLPCSMLEPRYRPRSLCQ